MNNTIKKHREKTLWHLAWEPKRFRFAARASGRRHLREFATLEPLGKHLLKPHGIFVGVHGRNPVGVTPKKFYLSKAKSHRSYPFARRNGGKPHLYAALKLLLRCPFLQQIDYSKEVDGLGTFRVCWGTGSTDAVTSDLGLPNLAVGIDFVLAPLRRALLAHHGTVVDAHKE